MTEELAEVTLRGLNQMKSKPRSKVKVVIDRTFIKSRLSLFF